MWSSPAPRSPGLMRGICSCPHAYAPGQLHQHVELQRFPPLGLRPQGGRPTSADRPTPRQRCAATRGHVWPHQKHDASTYRQSIDAGLADTVPCRRGTSRPDQAGLRFVQRDCHQLQRLQAFSITPGSVASWSCSAQCPTADRALRRAGNLSSREAHNALHVCTDVHLFKLPQVQAASWSAPDARQLFFKLLPSECHPHVN
jgi:hypothetical protein